MYLSDRDIAWAIKNGDLIISGNPKIDPTSVDLRLDDVSQAKVWDIGKLRLQQKATGVTEPELHLGSFEYNRFAKDFLIEPPTNKTESVFRRGNEVVVKPGGFLLWQTKEKVGTPDEKAGLICFIDGKSTRARTGILVHFTAPTIHAGWSGNVVLEITNLGPFHFVLKEDDVIAQLTIAKISSSPEKTHLMAGTSTLHQSTPSGASQSQTP